MLEVEERPWPDGMVARVEAGLRATRAAGGGGTPFNLLDWLPPPSGASGLLRGRTSPLRPHVLAKRGGASVTSMGSSLRPWAPAPTPPWSSDPLLLPLWVPTLGSTPWVLLLLPLWVLVVWVFVGVRGCSLDKAEFILRRYTIIGARLAQLGQ